MKANLILTEEKPKKQLLIKYIYVIRKIFTQEDTHGSTGSDRCCAKCCESSMLSAAPTADGENQKLKPGVYYIVNDKRQKGTDLHVFVDGKGTLHGQQYSSPSTDFSDLFLLHAKDGRYTIQSLKNAKYVQSVGQNNEVYKTADDAYKFRIEYQTESSGTGKSYFNIYNSNG